jgi:hypothetical protein
MIPENTPDKVYDVAKALGVDHQLVYDAVKEGKIPKYYVPNTNPKSKRKRTLVVKPADVRKALGMGKGELTMEDVEDEEVKAMNSPQTPRGLIARKLRKLNEELFGDAKTDEFFGARTADIINILKELDGTHPTPSGGTTGAPQPPAAAPEPVTGIVEERTQRKREKANLAAMYILANKRIKDLTGEDRKTIAKYSGWGGLSINRYSDPKHPRYEPFPEGFPMPDRQGIVNEYYTPAKLAKEIAKALVPFRDIMPRNMVGCIEALEPSAGIGRIVRAFDKKTWPDVRWNAVELSETSYTVLKALRPKIKLTNEPFEKWVGRNEYSLHGKIGLVVSNPPYGSQGINVSEEGSSLYREKSYTDYFLRRGLDLLGQDGIGVYIIPGGFMSGSTKSNAAMRRKVLKRHHVLAAFRLPTFMPGPVGGPKEVPMFPGAAFIGDVIFFQARGGIINKIPADDQYILKGKYYDKHPDHVLGEYQKRHREIIFGPFNGLPAFTPRPICTSCTVAPAPAPAPPMDDLDSEDEDAILTARSLGKRVLSYFACLADDKDVRGLHMDLCRALSSWKKSYGNPHHYEPAQRFKKFDPNVGAFLTAYEPSGAVVDNISKEPAAPAALRKLSLVERVDAEYRRKTVMSVADLSQFGDTQKVAAALFKADWGIDGRTTVVEPPDVYWFGDVWDKWEDCKRRRAPGRSPHPSIGAQYNAQAEKLAKIIGWDKLEDLTVKPLEAQIPISPIDPWVPLDVVEDWLRHMFADGWAGRTRLQRVDGILMVKGHPWSSKKGDWNLSRGSYVNNKSLRFIGWANNAKALFRPPKNGEEEDAGYGPAREKKFQTKTGDIETDEEARYRWIHGFAEWNQRRKDTSQDRSHKGWIDDFYNWLLKHATDDQRTRTEYAYNKTVRGWRAITFDDGPLDIARWDFSRISPHPYQRAGIRQMIFNRGGMLAYDVGVGKTFTGLGTIAKARELGIAKRCVLVVKKALVWNWVSELKLALPDFRFEVIGMSRRRGKGIDKITGDAAMVVDTDDADTQLAKWRRFQAGEVDVAIITPHAMACVGMRQSEMLKMSLEMTDILRAIKKNMKPTERQEEIIKRKAEEFVVGINRHEYTRRGEPTRDLIIKGIFWEDLKVDLLMMDEAQALKGLFSPEIKAKYLGQGSAKPSWAGSQIAWKFYFRSRYVREKNGMVCLLSATPAKNSPLEFYSMLRYVNENLWKSAGIDNPQSFIDRFLTIASIENYSPEGDAKNQPTVVGFRNTTQLRRLLFRYAKFLKADDVEVEDSETGKRRGLEVPQAPVRSAWVDNDSRQEVLRKEFCARFKASRSAPPGENDDPIIAIMGDMTRASVHPDLFGFAERAKAAGKSKTQYNYAVAQVKDGSIDPESPKITEMAKLISRNLLDKEGMEKLAASNPELWKLLMAVEVGGGEKETTKIKCSAPGPKCGHIVFANSVPVHAFIRATLVKYGVPANKIAIINATTAPGDKTTKIARGFNNGVFDVVIANVKAEEGVNLQKRTCYIHHLDLPWTPSSLQQRNGRGVRQGNPNPVVCIYFWLQNKSMDGYFLDTIQGKKNWLDMLLNPEGGDVMNNPAAMGLDKASFIKAMGACLTPEQVEDQLSETLRNSQLKILGKRRRGALSKAREISKLKYQIRRNKDVILKKRQVAEALQSIKELVGTVTVPTKLEDTGWTDVRTEVWPEYERFLKVVETKDTLINHHKAGEILLLVEDSMFSFDNQTLQIGLVNPISDKFTMRKKGSAWFTSSYPGDYYFPQSSLLGAKVEDVNIPKFSKELAAELTGAWAEAAGADYKKTVLKLGPAPDWYTKVVWSVVKDHVSSLAEVPGWHTIEEPIKDEDGNPVVVMGKDGNPVIDEDGKEVVKTKKVRHPAHGFLKELEGMFAPTEEDRKAFRALADKVNQGSKNLKPAGWRTVAAVSSEWWRKPW